MSEFNLEWIHYYMDKKPRVIFDIGCFDCTDSMQFKKRFPQANVYCFEASAKNFSRIINNPTFSSNLKLFNYAISDTVGEVDFYDSYGVNECSGSILQSNHKRQDLKFAPPVKVKTTTIDAFCKEQGITQVDVLHVDAQGAEYKILKGIGDFRPEIIFCETAEYDNYKGALTLEDFDDLMTDLGYRIEKALQYDTLFVKKDNIHTSIQT